MDLPTSFDYLKNVEIVLRPSQGDATASYAVTCHHDSLGDVVYLDCGSIGGGPWVFAPDEDRLRGVELSDIAEALEALNALENGQAD